MLTKKTHRRTKPIVLDLYIDLQYYNLFIFIGTSGSCMQHFSPMPYMFCNIRDVCTYASRTATSYWLATEANVPMMPVEGLDGLTPFISRCSVCQAPAPLLTIHSQTNTQPECPKGWTVLWSGYSFVMVSE